MKIALDIRIGDIYPSLDSLKNLVDNKTKLLELQKLLINLEMWQWHIEDVAQTPGNYPSMVIFTQRMTTFRTYI